MKWVRSNIKRVSRLALFALAVQLALSFGHVHGIASAQAALAAQSGSAQSEFLKLAQATDNLSAPRPASDQGPAEHPGDICAICVVMAMASTALFAAAPAILLPQSADFSYVAAAAEFVRAAHLRVAFQPRAPPRS